MKPKEVKQDNGLAIASLVLGILSVTSFSILTGIPAIITGAMSLKNPVQKGMAIAGIIMGALSVLFAIVIVAIFILIIGISANTLPEYFNEFEPNNDNSYDTRYQQT